MREGYIKNIRKDLQQFSDFLGDKKWFAGSEVCISVSPCVNLTSLKLHKITTCVFLCLD